VIYFLQVEERDFFPTILDGVDVLGVQVRTLNVRALGTLLLSFFDNGEVHLITDDNLVISLWVDGTE